MLFRSATDHGLVELLEARDTDACASWLESTRGLEAVRVISRLSEEQREVLLSDLSLVAEQASHRRMLAPAELALIKTRVLLNLIGRLP